jgi:CMP-N,N'-diacetyllegionaminic acid synthase
VIGNGKVLAVIPARGGSKGLPGKNILPVGGQPLIGYSIGAAKASAAVDRVIVSSDDDAIIAAARACGCDVPFRRPDELATDTAASIDVVLHALDQVPGYDYVVLLQPTSPLRTAADIDAACERLAESGALACVSVSPVEQSPYWMYQISDAGDLRPVLDLPAGVSRRQDLPPVYTLNGAIYVANVSWLRRNRTFLTAETVPYVMPTERSLDIDTYADVERMIALTSMQQPA